MSAPTPEGLRTAATFLETYPDGLGANRLRVEAARLDAGVIIARDDAALAAALLRSGGYNLAANRIREALS